MVDHRPWPSGRGVWVPAFAGTTADVVQRAFISPRSNSPRITPHCRDEGDVMERRHFLKLAFGFAAGAAALAASAGRGRAAGAATAHRQGPPPPGNGDAQPAVATGDEVDRLAPEAGALGPRARSSPGMGQAGLGLASPPLGLAPSPLGLASPPLASPPPPLLAPPLLLVRRDRSSRGRTGFRPPDSRDGRPP